MTKKEHTTITELFQVLDLLESLDMQFWLACISSLLVCSLNFRLATITVP